MLQNRTLRNVIAGLSWLYLAVLFAWLLAHRLSGDRIPLVGLINLLGVFMFAPLPLVGVAVALCRSRSLAVAGGAALLAFLALWGGQFMPRPNRAQPGGETLRVLTFNVLAHHQETAPILDVLREVDADVVLLQELNLNLAQAIQDELSERYPYHLLEAASSPYGIGTFSKFPLRETSESMPHSWIGGPILSELDWNGRTIRLVNFHMHPTTGLYSMARVARDFSARGEQARLLADYARQGGPTLLGGDANSAPHSDAHRILTAGLTDAWQARGFGMGHTFPGSTLPGSDRPKIGSWYVPPWLVRIDYIFTSPEWEVLSAHLAPVDGVSDHRGVWVELRLR